MSHVISGYSPDQVAHLSTDTQEYANAIARAVVVGYEDVRKPILTIQDAIAAQSFYPFPSPQQVLSVGDAPGKDEVHKSWLSISL